MQSKATTVAQYLKELPSDRRAMLETVAKVIRANLDPRLEEGISYGMIGWYVPHKVFSLGYHCDPKLPLPFAGLASQKNHCSLYLMTAYAEGTTGEAWIKKAWPNGKKLDMGKSCIRFKSLDDLALDVIGEAVRRVPLDDHLAWYASIDPRQRKQNPRTGVPEKSKSSKPAANKPAAKKK